MIKVALFDLDETLTTGRCPVMADVFRPAIAEVMGFDAGPEDVVHAGFTDLRTVTEVGVANGLDPETAQEMAREVLRRKDLMLGEAIAMGRTVATDSIRATAGGPEFVARLREYGVSLGLVTGNTRYAGVLKLVAAGYDPGVFSFGGYGDLSTDRAELVEAALTQAQTVIPGLRKSDVYVFGDTPSDVSAAHRVGVRAIAIASGRFTAPELHLTGAGLIVESLTKTDDIIEYLGL